MDVLPFMFTHYQKKQQQQQRITASNMDSTADANLSSEAPTGGDGSKEDMLALTSRAYQAEMFEKSLRRNVIVAMDTGTGKTRVAILRIRSELERRPPPMMVWFLAPTVLLCKQQCDAIEAHIPGVPSKIITGESNVEAWTTQHVWDEVLRDIRVVVATHQVLLDALQHGFVKLSNISLLIFDEAHRCVKLHAGRRIMEEFYHATEHSGMPRPAIMGLTASPVQGRKLDGLEELERTLDAVCASPTRHRGDLLAHTKRPSTFLHVCEPLATSTFSYYSESGSNGNVARLQNLCRKGEALELSPQEVVLPFGRLREQEVAQAWRAIRVIARRADSMSEDLGPWAANYFVYRVIRRCVRAPRQGLVADNDLRRLYFLSLLREVQAKRPWRPGKAMNMEDGNADDGARTAEDGRFMAGLSAKVQQLVEILAKHESARPTGIVFVRERPMAAVLARVLALHPALRMRYRTGYVVGMSKWQEQHQRQMQQSAGYGSGGMGSFFENAVNLHAKDSERALKRFRQRRLNLLVATSVLEEGIDIPACNLVVCIDRVTSLKEYVQRRGRAREQNSQFHLLISPPSAAEKHQKNSISAQWEALEQQMKNRYADEQRGLQHLERLESESMIECYADDPLLAPLYVPATQARLSTRDAKQHLHHFCETTSSAAFVSRGPTFRIRHLSAGDGNHIVSDVGFDLDAMKSHLLTASVHLPLTLPAHLRHARSAYAWPSEVDACADAAFQAYKALYHAGLVTDNLLPPRPQAANLMDRTVEGRRGMVTVHRPFRPWLRLAAAWERLDKKAEAKAKTASETPSDPPAPQMYRHTVRLIDDDDDTDESDENGYRELFCADLVLPVALAPTVRPVSLFWYHGSATPWTLYIGEARPESASVATASDDHAYYTTTQTLLVAAYGHRWALSAGHLLLRFACQMPLSQLQLGTYAFAPRFFDGQGPSPSLSSPLSSALLVRDASGRPLIYQALLARKPQAKLVRQWPPNFESAPDDAMYVVVRPFPKKVGLLHKAIVTVPNGAGDGDGGNDVDAGLEDAVTSPAKPYPTVVMASECTVDALPMAHVRFGALVPSLMPVIETYLVAQQLLQTTPLGQIPLKDISLVVTALSAPAARLPTNYEYLEFVGDSLLKLVASLNCAAQNLYSPEGHLSLFKDRLVANSRLCRAALDFGLDRFIMNQEWSLKIWKKLGDEITQKMAQRAEVIAEDDYDDIGEKNGGDTPRMMSTKMLADVVEALIGAFFFDGGLPAALECIRTFQPDKTWHTPDVARHILYEAAPASTPWPLPSGLEALVGHTFTKKALLLEAITHASAPPISRYDYDSNTVGVNVDVDVDVDVSADADIGCMERLEFLGDAVLDQIIVQRLAAIHPPLPHQRMHQLRTTLANAYFLGFVLLEFAATVNGPDRPARSLWTYLRHGASREMGQARVATARRYAALREPLLEALHGGATYPWLLLARLRPEKLYSDMLEAVVGAIYVDTGSLAAVEQFLDRIGLLPYLNRALRDGVHLMHPKEELGMSTGQAEVLYDVRVEGADEEKMLITVDNSHGYDDDDDDDEYDANSTDDDDDDDIDDDMQDTLNDDTAGRDALFSCRVFLDKECMGEVRDCGTREEAETWAAEVALRNWRERQATAGRSEKP